MKAKEDIEKIIKMIMNSTLNKKWTIKPLGEVVDFLDNLRKSIKASVFQLLD